MGKQRVDSEYLHISFCELSIYFDQTRGDCGETNHDCFGEVFFLFMASLNEVRLMLSEQGNQV